jgi:hypothetical protein
VDSAVLLLHGELGGWDELIIAGAAFVVLWVAVKLAGRKPAEAEEETAAEAEAEEESAGTQRPPATPMP